MHKAIAWIAMVVLMPVLAVAAFLVLSGPSSAQPDLKAAATIDSADGSQSTGSGEQIQVQIGASDTDSPGLPSPSGGIDALTTAPAAPAAGGGLAFTGFAIVGACLLACALLVGGLTFVFLGRGHRTAH